MLILGIVLQSSAQMKKDTSIPIFTHGAYRSMLKSWADAVRYEFLKYWWPVTIVFKVFV